MEKDLKVCRVKGGAVGAAPRVILQGLSSNSSFRTYLERPRLAWPHRNCRIDRMEQPMRANKITVMKDL